MPLPLDEKPALPQPPQMEVIEFGTCAFDILEEGIVLLDGFNHLLPLFYVILPSQRQPEIAVANPSTDQ